jgi:hypothetical protein
MQKCERSGWTSISDRISPECVRTLAPACALGCLVCEVNSLTTVHGAENHELWNHAVLASPSKG